MSEYRKAKPEEREACIEFADYVFSKAHCPHDFETLIPRVYGEGVDSASMHRIAVDERGKIRALIAVLRDELDVGGKALLAGKSKEEIQALYPQGLTALTPHTITDVDRLYYQLEEIERNGLAFECEESTPYIRCVAVPLRKDGHVRAAMSIAVPIFRYNPDKEAQVIRLLREAQIKIESLFAVGQWNGF